MPEIQGGHFIADDVIAAIVMTTATEVPGLYLPSGIANGFAERFGKKQSTKGVRIEQPEEGVVIDIKVAADYGINIPDACTLLQEKVASKVADLTGKEVAAVNVHVTDINMQSIPADEKEAESESS